MSAKKIYWRNRDGESPPAHAQFFWRPFQGPLTPLDGVQVGLPLKAVSYRGTPVYEPSKMQWDQNIAKVLGTGIEKVVLARRCQIPLRKPLNPFSLTAALQKKSLGACVFCVETPEFAFLGATPEGLFRREGRQIFTEALAGTRKRGKALEEELLKSDKDLREIFPVQRFLRETLEPLVESPVVFTPISIRKTAHVQHLYSRGEALLKEGISDAEIIMRLSPTPALAGFPRESALQMIAELEPFSRGLYGGVLGWETKERSEWVVAIRCCLLEKNLATLFSGTGIVWGSQPDAEWEELDQKLKLYEGVLL